MRRALPPVALALCLSLPALADPGAGTLAVDGEPQWLERMRVETSGGSWRISDLVGSRLAGRASAGLAIAGSGILLGTGLASLGIVGESQGPTLLGVFGGTGLAAVGMAGSGIALQRAFIDLRRRDVWLDPTVMHIGHVLAAAGTLSLATGIGVLFTFWHDDLGLGLVAGGALGMAAATVPYALQLRAAKAAYRGLSAETPEDPPRGWAAPYFDPASRGFGVAGTF